MKVRSIAEIFNSVYTEPAYIKYGNFESPGGYNYISYDESCFTAEKMANKVKATLAELKENDKHLSISSTTGLKKLNSFHMALQESIFQIDSHYPLINSSDWRARVEQRQRISDAPKTIPKKAHVEEQAKNMHLIITELLAPYEHKKDEEKENLERDEKFASVMLAQNTDGNIPLYLHYQSGQCRQTSWLMLKRIAKMKPEFKIKILTTLNSKRENFLHMAFQRSESTSGLFLDIIKTFGKNATVAQALYQSDNRGFTPLHCIFKSSVRLPKTSEGLETLLENQIIKPDIFLIREQTGRNILHLICERTINQDDDYRSLDTLCTYLEKQESLEYKDQPGTNVAEENSIENAIRATTLEKWNALHLACKSGDDRKVKRILANLSPEAKQEIASAKTVEGFTALHLACQYGNDGMLKTVTDALGQELYHIYETSNKQLLTLIEHNTNKISLSNYINTELCWIKTYEYLVKRSKETGRDFFSSSRCNDLQARKSDFSKCIELALTEKTIQKKPEFRSKISSWCCFPYASTQRYHEHRDFIPLKDNKQACEKFITFLKEKAENKEPIATELLKTLRNKKLMPTVMQSTNDKEFKPAPAPSAPEADSGEGLSLTSSAYKRLN